MEEDEFMPVSRKGKTKPNKGKKKADENIATQPTQTSITPISYAGIAAAAANRKQPPAPPKCIRTSPSITEIIVIRDGGHKDPQVEQHISIQAADAIIHEVCIKMAKAVANPILLRAGRWSIHPRSKGNFVYSFDGCIPFDTINSYVHILLSPFQGSGHLRPSLG
jgi:hypothetical protein